MAVLCSLGWHIISEGKLYACSSQRCPTALPWHSWNHRSDSKYQVYPFNTLQSGITKHFCVNLIALNKKTGCWKCKNTSEQTRYCSSFSGLHVKMKKDFNIWWHFKLNLACDCFSRVSWEKRTECHHRHGRRHQPTAESELQLRDFPAEWKHKSHKYARLWFMVWFSKFLHLFWADFVVSRCVPNRENEKLEVSCQVSSPQIGKPHPQPHAWTAEATPVHTLL